MEDDNTVIYLLTQKLLIKHVQIECQISFSKGFTYANAMLHKFTGVLDVPLLASALQLGLEHDEGLKECGEVKTKLNVASHFMVLSGYLNHNLSNFLCCPKYSCHYHKHKDRRGAGDVISQYLERTFREKVSLCRKVKNDDFEAITIHGSDCISPPVQDSVNCVMLVILYRIHYC